MIKAKQHIRPTAVVKLTRADAGVIKPSALKSSTWVYLNAIACNKIFRYKILAFEMYCYCNRTLVLGLHLNWTIKVTNTVARKRLNVTADVIQTVGLMERKLGLFGHTCICRIEDSRKIKIVILGIMDGKWRRGRPNWSGLLTWSNGANKICTA